MCDLPFEFLWWVHEMWGYVSILSKLFNTTPSWTAKKARATNDKVRKVPSLSTLIYFSNISKWVCRTAWYNASKPTQLQHLAEAKRHRRDWMVMRALLIAFHQTKQFIMTIIALVSHHFGDAFWLWIQLPSHGSITSTVPLGALLEAASFIWIVSFIRSILISSYKYTVHLPEIVSLATYVK